MIFGFLKKLALEMAEAKKYSQDKPLLIYTDLKVVDENLSVLHESMIHSYSVRPCRYGAYSRVD